MTRLQPMQKTLSARDSALAYTRDKGVVEKIVALY